MAERTRRRSPVTQPGYRRGMAPGNKGMKLPAEILAPHEVESLVASFGTTPTDRRNRAIVTLAYRAGLKIGEILALERRHYEPGAQTLTIPARKRAPEREIALDAPTRRVIGEWMDCRKALGVRGTAPLLCTVSVGALGNRLSGSYVRGMLRRQATSAGIDRRVTAEGLRHSGKRHRQASQWRMEPDIGRYLDEALFRGLHPGAYEKWRMALDLFAVHPDEHAAAIGSACREALAEFASGMVTRRGLRDMGSAGTIDQLRATVRDSTRSKRASAHGQALVGYWGTVADLANRQAHGARREREPLTAEDARRLIFHTMVVMYEVDRLAASRS